VLRVMGKEKGWEFLKQFGEQELVVVRGNNLRAQQLAAGEFPFGFSYAHQIDRMKKDNAPVDWVKSENIFVVNLLHPVFVSPKPSIPMRRDFSWSFAFQRRPSNWWCSWDAKPHREPMSRLMCPKPLDLCRKI
jgi:hypothetical protein